MKWVIAILLFTGLGHGLGCSDDPPQVVVRNLDGPSDVAFACVGDLRITDTGEVVASGQPLRSCTARFEGEIPEGQEDVVPPSVFSFVLQSTRGTVAIVDNQVDAIADSDPFAPGRNAIPIGTLPVGIVSDNSGCYVVAANAGSCDLAVLDVQSAVSKTEPAQVTRVTITNAGGEPLSAKPRVIEPGQLPSDVIGTECPETSSGLAYIGFPGCNLVGAVNLSSGALVAGVRLLDGGLAEITDGNITCPNQCGTGTDSAAVVNPNAGSPVEVELSPDGNRVYIGSQNTPVVTVVNLDPATHLPVALSSVSLEGDVGVTAIAATETVSIGGAFNSVGEVGVDFSFAYAIATDGSVRVFDAVNLVECDTQVDPRYLRDETNIEVLGCFSVGDVATPPRRAGARGPGIRFPNDAVPLDIEIVRVEGDGTNQAEPNVLVGTFGFITASDGNTFVINIDDDNYPDFEEPNNPAGVWMTLAVPHQLRDFVTFRNFIQLASCVSPSNEFFEYPPRLSGDVGRNFGGVPPVNEAKELLLPNLRRVECKIEQQEVVVERNSVSELSMVAPVAVRERTFPDLLRAQNEDWFITWEGSLSLDAIDVAIDGRPVRSGVLDNNQGLVTVTEAGAPFCGLGVEPYDFLELFGCDPSRGDAQCSLGETCYVHPETPSNIGTGMCLPREQVDTLAGRCRDVLVTNRRYTVLETYASQLVLAERARVLRTSPIDGCVSDDECQAAAVEEDRITSAAHPIEVDNGAVIDSNTASFTWTCQSDGTRKPGPDKCVMTCGTSADCEDGTVCSSGVCVEGKLPPDECTQAVLRYRLRAGEAFAVVGTVTGFLHNRVADPDTRECIADPDASELLVGRIPLAVEDCVGDGFTDLSPNPCAVASDTYEEITPFEARGATCVAQPQVRELLEAEAIRFSNPTFTAHLVGLSTTGDAVCNGDGAGELSRYSPLFQDFSIGFTVTGGFLPQFVSNRGYLAEFPVRIRRGPLGLLWIMDQGDDRNPSQLTRGRVLTIAPDNAPDGFTAKVPLL